MSSLTASDDRPWLPQFLLGARMFVPLAISISAYGVVWGVLAGQAGLTLPEVALMSGLVFAGASQFVALEIWTPGNLPVGAIVLAVAIVNLRLMLMTATLGPITSHLSRPRALAAMFLVADENWAMTMAEVNQGRGSVAYLLGGGALSWLAWFGSTVVGRALGAFIDDPVKYGLDFAFTATFIALLFGMWKGKAQIVPWAVAALVAIVTAKLVPGHWHIIAGGLAGSLTGAIIEQVAERRRVA
jgi:predicted branched-subunit amino acid permease